MLKSVQFGAYRITANLDIARQIAAKLEADYPEDTFTAQAGELAVVANGDHARMLKAAKAVTRDVGLDLDLSYHPDTLRLNRMG